MDEKMLKQLAKTYSPHARIQALLELNHQVSDTSKRIANIQTLGGKKSERAAKLKTLLEKLNQDLKLVAEPAITCPVETGTILRMVKWQLFDNGVGLQSFPTAEDRELYSDIEAQIQKVISRLPKHACDMSRKISDLLRTRKYLPCLQSQVSYQEKQNQNVKLKGSVLCSGLILSALFALGAGSLQPLVPGIFMTFAAYIFVSIASVAGDPENAPGGFASRFGYLDPVSRSAIKRSMQRTFEHILQDYRWMPPVTVDDMEKLREKCEKKLKELVSSEEAAAANTQTSLAE